ncbi:MAG TPA: hypothetical protein DHV14_05890 [Micrococcales bacterium]|uniref:hypothetical protein n=1 Tax=Miniimonas arenae TaxID=676201 RepID=UPI000EE7DBCC|nr:hypothetical protein [Miniimonas arenae]HCX84659.1 hypothetical protein [Micrococcales bacterium]
MPRRSPAPSTWLTLVEQATTAYTGSARLLTERAASAGETPFRGGGFTLTLEVEPATAVFGDAPDGPVELTVQTALAERQREAPGALRFPPDLLRRVSYADQARPDARDDVLVLAVEPPVVRGLVGSDDDLPTAVATVRGWLTSGADSATVLGDLPSAPAVAVVAGVELALRSAADSADAAALIERVLAVEPLAAGAVRGVLELVDRAALGEGDLEVVADALLDRLGSETDPDAAVAALGWLDAHRDVTGEEARAELAAALPRLRELDAGDAGGDTTAWRAEIARFADAVE